MLVFSTFLYYLQGIQSIIFYNFKDENDKSKFMKKLILCTLLFLAYSCDTEDSASEENTSVFLTKNNNTIWSDPDLYYGEYPDIKFSNAEYFISFFSIDVSASYCEGWKKGETIYDGVKWEITITKEEENTLWFDYDHYGFGEFIEYSITHKYNIVDNNLFYTNSNGDSFIFAPSQKNYAEDFLDTGAVIKLDGCMFY